MGKASAGALSNRDRPTKLGVPRGRAIPSRELGRTGVATTSRAPCYDDSVLARLPPTSPDLALDETQPYFLWWTDATVADLRRHLASHDADERAYWLGALLREANTRDVWLFVGPDVIRAAWPDVFRYLGRARAMWAYLLGLEPPHRLAPTPGRA